MGYCCQNRKYPESDWQYIHIRIYVALDREMLIQGKGICTSKETKEERGENEYYVYADQRRGTKDGRVVVMIQKTL